VAKDDNKDRTNSLSQPTYRKHGRRALARSCA
jgi:hypothetical protein